MEKLVSIIIPAYNVESYIEECIKSLINQTYQNIEVIIIDDGSTDKTLNIIKKYKDLDSRIVYLVQENSGMSKARNKGIEYSNGEYISFIDSDDIVCSNFISLLVKNIENGDYDISVCDYFKFSDNMNLNVESNDSSCLMFSSNEGMKLILKDELLGQMVWNKLYKSELVKRVRFIDNKYHEDTFWTYEIIGNSKKIIYTSFKLYGYRQRVGSIMNRPYFEKRVDEIYATISRRNYVKINYPNLIIEASLSIANCCLYHYQLIDKQKPNEYKKIKNKIFLLFKQENLDHYFRYANFKQMIWFYLFSYIPNLTCKLRNFFNIGI